MPAQRSPISPFLQFLSNRSSLLALLLTLIATIRIVATYPVFSHTSDEPAHLACGMEWLSKGTYRYEAHCLVLLASSSVLAHPDYLPYFNLLAGGHPEKIAVDSDLDWGQDIKRLGHRLRELGAKHVVYTPLIISELDLFGFPPRLAIDPVQPLPGYNAVSLTQLKLDRLYLPEDHPALQPWPERVAPAEVVGKTILLYSFPSIPPKP